MDLDDLKAETRLLYDKQIRKTTQQLAEANDAVVKDTARVKSLLKQQVQQNKNRDKVGDMQESKLRAFLVDNGASFGMSVAGTVRFFLADFELMFGLDAA